MIIEICNVDFINKGSSLMIHAITDSLSAPNIKFAVDLRAGGNKESNKLGLMHVLRRDIYTLPLQVNPYLNFLGSLVPSKVKKSLKVIQENEADIILDSSGFAYSDQGNYKLIEMMAERFKMWRRLRKKIILLPQAFGPFDNPKIKDKVQEIISCADICYARDSLSYSYLMNLTNSSLEKIKLAPDFTNLIDGRIPQYFTSDSQRPCIIPNFRMITETNGKIRDRYIPTLISLIHHLLKNNMNPFILIHESKKDNAVAKELMQRLGKPLLVINESNPVLIKGLLGTCPFVICSRFHGLVSSLSQGVPAIATGWSHKYQMLYKDYDCENMFITFDESENELLDKLDLLVNPESRNNIGRVLIKNSEIQKQLTRNMWGEVIQLITG